MPPPYLPTPPPTAATPHSQRPLVGEGKPIKVLVTGFGVSTYVRARLFILISWTVSSLGIDMVSTPLTR